MNHKLDVVYEFDLTEQVQFGNIPIEQLHKLFQDGRVASKFMEHSIPSWFSDLEFKDQKGFDHKSKSTGRQYDLKGFTKGGACYAPSNMLGVGRSIDKEKLHAHANTIDYIFSDITEFPKVRLIFKSGSELVKKYPSGKISIKEKNTLFQNK